MAEGHQDHGGVPVTVAVGLRSLDQGVDLAGRQVPPGGASDKRESTRSTGGKDARRATVRGQKAAAGRAQSADGDTRQELYAQAQRRHIEGRSKMTKRQLKNALGVH
jgi:hypothetical protein